MVKGPYYDKNGVKRGAWSKKEDEKLRAYVERYGHSNWHQLPNSAGLARYGKSCRLRSMFSNCWAITRKVTDNEVKNHWHSPLKKCLICNRESITEPGDISEAHTTQSTESENPILAAVPSYDTLESLPPKSNEERDYANTSWEIFQESSNFWAQSFIPDSSYSQYDYYSPNDYAANVVDVDEYLSYFLDNTEFLCQAVQELPNDPKRDNTSKLNDWGNIKAKSG